MAKLWAGRLNQEIDKRVDALNASVSYDKRLYPYDIAGSIAHAQMLGKTGIISQKEADKLVCTLQTLLQELDDGILVVSETAEDIHMFIEEELTKRLGSTGKRLHTARSRNDQVALDFRLYLRQECSEIKALIQQFICVLLALSEQHLHTIMPGYTHLQRAQPITFAHHLMAYVQMFLRDIDRLNDWDSRADECPLGSGALAGVTYPISREETAATLGFSRITQNSLDGVSDRDFALEFLSVLSICSMHLSRMAEELITWCSWEFQFISLNDKFATGSSIMPQKKNPDIPELIRSKTGRIYGNLMTLLTAMKGLPLAYNKDMQEDKEAVFDAVDQIKSCLIVAAPMLETMQVNKEKMKAATEQGFLNATDCADYLVKKGLPFREAYQITGKLVSFCIEQKRTLHDLTLCQFQEHSPLFEEDIFQAIDLNACVNIRNTPGGPAPTQVKKQIDSAKERLNELSANQ